MLILFWISSALIAPLYRAITLFISIFSPFFLPGLYWPFKQVFQIYA